jgi:cysteine desulfurase family protein
VILLRNYFDNAATSFPKPKEVVDALTDCMQEYAVNAGRGVYGTALRADRLIATTREKIKKLLGVYRGHLVFSASASLALNQVILGLAWKHSDVVYTTQYEHNSVSRVVHQVSQEYEASWEMLHFDLKTMTYDLEAIKKQFFVKPPSVLVLSHVSNVFGVITPIEAIAKLAKEYDAVVIVDGAQGGALLPLQQNSLVDFYIFSGHKTFYGPFGIAGIWANGGVKLKPILYGGTGSHSELLSMPEELPYSLEIGSPNIVGIAGLSAACDWLSGVGPDQILKHERELNRIFVSKLQGIHGIKIWSALENAEKTGITSFLADAFTPQEIGMILDQTYNCAVRTGLHCSPMAHKLLNTHPKGTVRVSFGWFNTEDEVEILIRALKEILEL